MGDKIANFRRDVKIIKKNQMEILEMKIIFEIKNSLAGIN